MFGMALKCSAGSATFGSGENTFQMEFVTIGNPGNGSDFHVGIGVALGSVGYNYGIGKYEVSEDMITKFNRSQSLQIPQYTEVPRPRGPNKPATNVSWNNAARFVNWLNTSTGGFPAYKFTTDGVNDYIELWTQADFLDFDPSNRFRSKRATFVLPSHHEWHKAAYYDPNKPGGARYWEFPNGSDLRPMPIQSGVDPDTAVYEFQPGPADVNLAGGLSPYGVMGLGGNVWELEESTREISGLSYNDSPFTSRGYRGGGWVSGGTDLSASTRKNTGPDSNSLNVVGFRVVTLSPDTTPPVVPEPSMMVIGSILGIGGLMAKRRMKKLAV
jgi:formylglycine-generating enzyme required for sulfatase activity